MNLHFAYLSILIFAFMQKPIFAGSSRDTILQLSDNVMLEMIYIPPGDFLMGSPDDEYMRQPDEGPVTKVTISKGFYMGKYVVTQQQWEALMEYNPSTFHRFEDSPQRPVDRVSWEDTQMFLERINELGIGNFRLPTEAEWEYACRAGSTDRFPWGVDSNYRELFNHAWFFSRSIGQSRPVGQKKPNEWGLYDMFGNVWEWCSDWMGPFSGNHEVDPVGPEHGERKIIRGGSWFNEPEALRSANRNAHIPQSRQTNNGFRLVLDIE